MVWAVFHQQGDCRELLGTEVVRRVSDVTGRKEKPAHLGCISKRQCFGREQVLAAIVDGPRSENLRVIILKFGDHFHVHARGVGLVGVGADNCGCMI